MKSLGEDHLDYIACNDVILGPSHHGLEVFRHHIGLRWGVVLCFPGRFARFNGGLQHLGQVMDLLDRLVVDRSKIFPPLGNSTGHHLDCVPHIVKDHQGIGNEESRIIGLEIIIGCGRELFEIPDYIISEKSHGSTIKPGESIHGNGAVAV